jgi:hypothetical protein
MINCAKTNLEVGKITCDLTGGPSSEASQGRLHLNGSAIIDILYGVAKMIADFLEQEGLSINKVRMFGKCSMWPESRNAF